MRLYAESSAVLTWLMGDDRGGEVASAMGAAEGIVASDVTLVDCDRVLIRAWSLGLISEVERVDLGARVAEASRRWTRMRVSEEVLERSRRPFPVEPIRALDALHLGTALLARSAAPNLAVLTLDQRIRENAERLGFEVLP